MRTRHINIFLLLTLLLSSCKDSSSLPKDIEKRIEGEWVVKPNSASKTFIMYRLSKTMDKCLVYRFGKNRTFDWFWLDKNKIDGALCGNSLRPSDGSNWQIDKENDHIIIDKIMTSVEERKEQKKSYRIYEFKKDSFILRLDKCLINEFEWDK